MNKQKRKDLDKAHDLIVQAIEIISSIAGEEQDSYYNLPDSLQSSYMGECLQGNADTLNDIASTLEDIDCSLCEVMEN